jgi:heme-degrading monooxygenase HmoA
MILEHAEFRAKPGAAAELEAAFEGFCHLLLEAPGCAEASLLRSVDEPDTYLLRVRWDRLEDHVEVFSSTAAAAELRAAFEPHCDGPPRVVHFDAG